MNKLLKANFSRLKRETSLWLVAGATLGLTIAKILDNYKYNEKITLDDMIFEMIPFIGIVCALFIAPFLGKEYSDGTIRNKLVVGHKRGNMYLANYIACLAGSLFICSMFFVGGFAVGVPLVGGWQGEINTLVNYILMSVCITASLASILTMFCMLCSKRALSAVLSILIMFALMLIASIIYNQLGEPEITREFIGFSAEGVVELGDPVPNPVYVSGFKRTVCEFLMQFLPTGQGILIANNEITQPVLNIVYSVVTAVIFNFCGIIAFKKKDLK